MPNLERILTAAVRAMVHGRHTPHCYRAHVPGRGYINDGSKVCDRADYLRQLEQTATSEAENMQHAPGYAERGYTAGAKGVLFANWNVFPRGLDTLLERAGFSIEWSDEWITCDDCQRAFRTVGDSYVWSPSGVYLEGSRDYNDPYQRDGGATCLDCLQDWAQGCRKSELEDQADASEVSL